MNGNPGESAINRLQLVATLVEREVMRYPRIVPPFRTSGESDLMTWQRKHWGIDSSAITAKLLRHWNMPGEIAAAVECHLIQSEFPAREASLLRLAACVASREGYGISGESLGHEENAREQGKLSTGQFDDAVGRAVTEFNSAHNLVM